MIKGTVHKLRLFSSWSLLIQSQGNYGNFYAGVPVGSRAHDRGLALLVTFLEFD